MDAPRKSAVEKKINLELLGAMRRVFQAMPPIMTHEARGHAAIKEFPQFTASTLDDYSRMCLNVCEEIFQRVMAGEISITALREFQSFDEATQRYLGAKYGPEKLTPKLLRKIRRYTREQKMGYEEAIARAKGVIPEHQPRKEQRKTLDQVLTQIADLGARWRALVAMALEMIQEEEAVAGVHEIIFSKVFLLRQMVGEQYDFVNSKVQRYMNLIKKRIKEAQDTQDAAEVVSKKDEAVLDAEFVERPIKNDSNEE